MRKRGLWYRTICLPVRHVRVLLMAEDIVNHLANIVGRSPTIVKYHDAVALE